MVKVPASGADPMRGCPVMRDTSHERVPRVVCQVRPIIATIEAAAASVGTRNRSDT